MLRIAHLATALVLVIFTAGCAKSPTVLNETDDVRQIRKEFLLTHPDGQYNNFILKGEVIKGMNLMEVIAAWGLPDARQVDSDEDLERWKYFWKDEVSKDWFEYTVVFEKRVMSTWDVTLHVTKYRPLQSMELEALLAKQNRSVVSDFITPNDIGVIKRR